MRSIATRTSASSPSPSSRRGAASSYNGTEQPRFSIKDDLTISKGSHTIKTGFTFDRQQANGFGQQDIGGRAGFSFLETAVPGATTLANGGGSSFASFLLGAADTGRTETIRYLQQIYPYYGFYAQDDWRINDKLVLNYGLRYEFTQPPRAGGDQYSDFSPTKPNPAVNNYPGALVFAGDGPGREGTSSLFPGYYGALAPRVSFAYSANDKTIVRGGVGRSFGRVTVVQGSSHFAGFIGQYVFSSADAGVTPAFNLDQGLPPYPLPPLIDPTFSNNNDVDWFNGQAASRPAQYDNWTMSVQRELRRGLTVELDYNGVYGSNLQAGLLNPNQVPMSVVNDLIARFGPTGARDLLNSQITSAGRGGRRHPRAVSELHEPQRAAFADGRPGAAALSAVPRGERAERRRRQDRPFPLSRRRREGESADDGWRVAAEQLHLLEADDRCRQLQRQRPRDGCRAARARVVGRPVRSDAHHQDQLGVRAAVRRRAALAARPASPIRSSAAGASP